MEQSIESKRDAHEILSHIASYGPRQVGYAHYTTYVQLKSRPDGWDDNRVLHALIDVVDGGWSPFGGRGGAGSPLVFQVTVHTD